jgi:hypothetical protein
MRNADGVDLRSLLSPLRGLRLVLLTPVHELTLTATCWRRFAPPGAVASCQSSFHRHEVGGDKGAFGGLERYRFATLKWRVRREIAFQSPDVRSENRPHREKKNCRRNA